MDYEAEPTIVDAEAFNAAESAEALRAAMKGLGTDEDTIIGILTGCSNRQRQEIEAAFEREFSRNLIEDLKGELGGNFEDVILALVRPPYEFLCRQLNKAMEGMGTDDSALVEILCPLTSDEMKVLVAQYEDLYGRPLAEHLCSETSGHFRRLITLIVTGVRDPAGTVDPALAAEQAASLYDAGAEKLGTDEEVFNRIFSHCSFAQLRLVFDEYKALSGKTIEQALKSEMDGDLLDGFLAIVECVQSPAAFFAQRLHKAMDGAGTDDPTLIRIIVCRSEIDLQTIKNEYERVFDRTLLNDIKGETSGDYKSALCAIIGNA
uniref:Annexin n=1 Tax=Phlebotomus kandelakii TaxID=1109342 RepID=A0A6B2E5S9_9DIPT